MDRSPADHCLPHSHIARPSVIRKSQAGYAQRAAATFLPRARGTPLTDDRHPQMINVYEHDNTRPAETKLPVGQCQQRAERLLRLGSFGGSLPRGDRRVPARVTRRRSPPVIVPAAFSRRSSADGQACSAKVAAFAEVFAEGTARCWWSPPSAPGYWWLRRPQFRALPRCHACGRPASRLYYNKGMDSAGSGAHPG